MARKPKTLQGVRSFLNRIPAINYGGCGISSLAMYNWLKKNNQLTKDTRFVFVYTSEEAYQNNAKIYKGQHGRSYAPSHAFLLHQGRFVDSEGLVTIHEYDWVQIIDNPRFVKRTIKEGYWNPSFKRDPNVKKIEKTLDIELNVS